MYDKLNQLTESHRQLRPGHGLVTGGVTLVVATLCFLGVPAGFWRQLMFPFTW